MQAFGAQFITCNKVPQPIGSLLSMRMRSGEIFQFYMNRYWELYNEIGGGNEQVVASNFRMGFPKKLALRVSLTMLTPEDMHQLMRRIEEYKRLEDNRL